MKASSRAIEAAWEAKNALAAGDEDIAFAASVRAVSLGDLSPETTDLFRLLAETRDPLSAAELLGQALEDTWGDWPPEFHSEVATLRFDLLTGMGKTGPDLADAALATLEAAAGGGRGERAWAPIEDPTRRRAILAAVEIDPAAIADALEHLAFA
ncbi:MAG: hypothetical protein ACR2J8_08250, partial [Thermomicrobiales bacterium]